MPLLAHYLPEPPAIVAMLTAEAMSGGSQVVAPEDLLVRYANALKTSLDDLVEAAKEGRLDLERILWEIRQEEIRKASSARQAEQRAKKWRREIAKFAPALKAPKTRAAARLEVAKAEVHATNSEALARLERDVYSAFHQCRESLDSVRAVRLKEYRREFEAFLKSMPRLDESKAVPTAWWAWDLLKETLNAPECSPSDDGIVLV